MARSAFSYRAARRNWARKSKILWSEQPRRMGRFMLKPDESVRCRIVDPLGKIIADGSHGAHYGTVTVVLPGGL